MRFLILIALLSSCAAALVAQPRQSGAGAGKLVPPFAFERFSRMSPEQRERMLDRLPPDRRAAVKERIQRFNDLPPDAKKRLGAQFDHFRQLPPEQQDVVRKTFREFKELPRERRAEIRRELHKLRRISSPERQARLASEEFRRKFNSGEQNILETLSHLLGVE
jgi:hypothetical protein